MFGAGVVELVLLLLVVVALALGVLLFVRSLGREQVRAARAEARRLQAVLDDVRELAWSQRELDPDLSTIIVDTIRSAERSHRPELPG